MVAATNIGNISTLSLVSMMISAALSILVPIILVIILGIRRRMNWKAMLTGAGLFIVFVLILERLMHTAVLGRSSIASVLLENKWIYMLYAGFAAGIFEETARLLGFRFLVRVSENEHRYRHIIRPGHGGIESIIIVGLSNISNIAAAFMHNSGVWTVRSTLSGAEQELLDQQIRALATTPPYEFRCRIRKDGSACPAGIHVAVCP